MPADISVLLSYATEFRLPDGKCITFTSYYNENRGWYIYTKRWGGQVLCTDGTFREETPGSNERMKFDSAIEAFEMLEVLETE